MLDDWRQLHSEDDFDDEMILPLQNAWQRLAAARGGGRGGRKVGVAVIRRDGEIFRGPVHHGKSSCSLMEWPVPAPDYIKPCEKGKLED